MATRAIRWRRERLPDWLKQPLSRTASGSAVDGILRGQRLHTICEEARCPNRNHCYSRGTATFLILGDRCTRSCRFCSVKGGPPLPPDPGEPERLLEAVIAMGLRHVVITSVNRDDLPDQGCGQFVRCIESIRAALPEVRIEVLIPDFRGIHEDMDRVFHAAPDILNHNIETVPRLYRRVRPGARYERSLALLARARKAKPRMWVKSGLMLGLGEAESEVDRLLLDLHAHGVQIVTIGQYLPPSPEHLPVEEYVHPDRYVEWEARGRAIGFDMVFAGPFVRSSYMADAQVPLL
ncbi:MAG: lipoyl synthase [Planctomycetes bacterium]|nr:lipoyl synthase [Planctomycetota bacterium]